MCWLCRSQSGPTVNDAPVTSRFSPAAPAAPADQPQDAAARLQLTLTGHAGVDGLLSGYAWDSATTVTFSFTDSSSDYEAWYGSNEPTRGFRTLGTAMRDELRGILTGSAGNGTGPGVPGPSVEGFTNLDLAEASVDSTADIRYAHSSAPSTAWGYYPNGREGGDVWFGSRAGFDTPRLGSYEYLVGVHETGHALGLKHPHESWNGFGAMPLEYDTLEFTVMSYRSHEGLSTAGGYVNGTFDYPQGWMMLDIAALQNLYGADYGFNAGNTRYSWNVETGEMSVDGIGKGAAGANRVFLTIWDGGGIDTYDLSNYANGVAVDLAPGGWSVTSSAQLAVLDTRAGLTTTARGNVFNALEHAGNPASLIENAIGGAGADTLLGNDAINQLSGGAGNDLLDGRAGNDVLDGGTGADTMIGGTGDDRYIVDNAGDRVVEKAAEGFDTIVSLLRTFTLPTAVEVLVLGAGAVTGIGNAMNNMITGNAAANRLEGAAGDDVLEGRAGNDTLVGGAGEDTFILRKGDGLDRIEDFVSGTDKLALTGFGLTAAQAMASLHAVTGGLQLDLGHGDGVILAGLTLGHFLQSDLIL